jgi:hypothetical protein
MQRKSQEMHEAIQKARSSLKDWSASTASFEGPDSCVRNTPQQPAPKFPQAHPKVQPTRHVKVLGPPPSLQEDESGFDMSAEFGVASISGEMQGSSVDVMRMLSQVLVWFFS